ncbi:serpin family protein [Streptomyces sp. NPDC058373]|uniref:serpin family protein n=1 Tax=Streptomyces sp. NPDC058373 TaxID=3346465 RepID=UPI00365BB8BD
MRELAIRWLPLAGRGDFALSPVGLWLALAALSVGARGGTAAELRRLLGVDGATAARAVARIAATLDATGALRHATRIWSRVPLEPGYVEALPGVGCGPMDAAAVDAWVRKATDGMVERLPLHLTDATLLVLVDALVLKARWADPFSGSATRPRDFTAGNGTVHAVPTMHRSFPATQAWTARGEVRVLDLGCASSGPERSPARVRFALGPPGAPPADVLAATWAPSTARTPLDAGLVAVALPRLALRTTRDATGDVAALGAPTALTDAADFGGLSPVPLALSQVVQESVVRVAEHGVEAAAVTAVATRFGAPPPPDRVEHLAFDRPFGIAVLDSSGTLPLFTAWQSGAPEDPGAEAEGGGAARETR